MSGGGPRAERAILVVDDHTNMRGLLKKVLRDEGRVLVAASGEEALGILEHTPVAVVLSDLRMGAVSGLELLRAVRRLQPGAEFVLMTAFASVTTAVEAMRLGAYDYLTKPFEPEEVRTVVRRALARSTTAREDPSLEVLPGLWARSAPMRELADLVRRVARSSATVLLLGETGTGKERIARAVHALGPRGARRFVAVNCAAIPAELLESELFGYARGAFTGAEREREGLVEAADGGSLFLDEIGELRLSLQAKLNRVLEERAVRRIGEARERRVDVRVIAATHRRLEHMAETGAFREDLFYRLNVAALRVPPLRERPEDVELLAHHFFREARAEGAVQATELSPAALAALARYRWPGNVRQLRSAIQRAAIVATGPRLEAADLPPEIGDAAAGDAPADLTSLPWAEALERAKEGFAKEYLNAMLDRHGGRVADAAAAAGVERESFYRLMRRYGVRA
ncbi:MAG: sigma-54-dependent transcriptional regulator [Sandaracinaceae bacterium]